MPHLSRRPLCSGPRHALLVIAVAVAAFTLPVSAATAQSTPDPSTCTGYPEPRVPLESQSWWSRDADVDNPQPDDHLTGRDEHAHIRVCLPRNVVVSGTVQLDLDMMVHETPGGFIRKARIQDRDDTLINDDLTTETKPLCAPTGECRYVATYRINTDTLATGRHEFRFHNLMERPDGAQSLATNGWHVCIRSCTPEVSQAVFHPEEEGRGRWFEPAPSSTDYGYNNARLRSDLPWSSNGYRPLAGTWCPTIRTMSGAGGRPVVRSLIAVDPRFHDYTVPGHPNGFPGTVILDEPNAINRAVCIDTTKLPDGMHKLYMRADGQAATGKQGGVYVIPFLVHNGSFSPPTSPAPTPTATPTTTPPADPTATPTAVPTATATPHGPHVEVLDPSAGERDPNPVTLNARATGATRMDYEVDGRRVAFDDTAANGFDEKVNLTSGGYSLVCIATVNGTSYRSEPRPFSVP